MIIYALTLLYVAEYIAPFSGAILPVSGTECAAFSCGCGSNKVARTSSRASNKHERAVQCFPRESQFSKRHIDQKNAIWGMNSCASQGTLPRRAAIWATRKVVRARPTNQALAALGIV